MKTSLEKNKLCFEEQTLEQAGFGKNTNWTGHTGNNDIWSGMRSAHVWLALGWHDTRQRYRRSVLGPFWFTLSTLLMVGVLGVLYSTLLGQKISVYLPYLGTGLVTWGYISSVVNEGCATFIGSAYMIKQIRMPLTVYVCRVVWRNIVIFLHSLPVIVLVLFWFAHYPKPEFLLVFPAIFILMLQGVWVGIVFGLLCARYRDVVPIVTNLLQVAFFFTPVMWSPDLLKERAWVAHYNPLYHLIQIVRDPVLGNPVEWQSWAWSIGLLLFGFSMAQYLMSRYRDRVPYWL